MVSVKTTLPLLPFAFKKGSISLTLGVDDVSDKKLRYSPVPLSSVPYMEN